MKFTQSSKKNSTFKNLSIDPETFAELRSESQRKYTFSLRFRIARNEENLRSIVVVTVKEKEPKNTTPGLTKKSSKIQTESVGLKDNLQVATIASKSALCTFAGARFISSASTKLAKTGPFFTVNCSLF